MEPSFKQTLAEQQSYQPAQDRYRQEAPDADIDRLVNWKKGEGQWNFQETITWNLLNKRQVVKNCKNDQLRLLL